MPYVPVSVERRGSSEWPRWVIVNAQRQHYTGADWSDQSTDARLYADEQEAQSEVTLMRSFQPRDFETTVHVTLTAADDIDVAEIRDFLERNAKGWIGGDGGEHPCDRASIEIEIDWNRLNETDGPLN